MADTDKLKPYKRGNPPTLPDNGKFTAEELRRLEVTLGTVMDVLKRHETRLTTGGL